MKNSKQIKTVSQKTKKETRIKLEDYEELDETEELLLSTLNNSVFDEDDEEEIEETNDEEFEYIEYEDEQETKQKKRNIKEKNKEINYKLIINIVFTIIMVILFTIAVDVIAVARYDSGPFFAFNTETYKDGGTKVYYGFGYKVIKYNQIEGRKGKVVGTWSLEYSVEPTPIDILDLAIEFENDKNKTSNKLYNQYLKVTGVISKIDAEKQQILMEYKDIDGKYTLELVTNVSDEVIISTFKEGDNVEVYGTAKKFSAKTNKKPNTIILNECFVKKIEK